MSHDPRFFSPLSPQSKRSSNIEVAFSSSRRARASGRPFTHARASSTPDGTSHLTVYYRGPRRYRLVSPPRLAIDRVARVPAPVFAGRRWARDPNAPDAIARREERGATQLERREAMRRALAARWVPGTTRYPPASSSAAAESRSRVSPVARRTWFPTRVWPKTSHHGFSRGGSRLDPLLRDSAADRPPVPPHVFGR